MTPALLTPLSRHAGTNMPIRLCNRAAAGVARRLFLCNERSMLKHSKHYADQTLLKEVVITRPMAVV